MSDSSQGLSSLFYRKPRLTVLFLGFLLVASLAAIDILPRQEDPTLSRRFGRIQTFYPGADALRVEALVTEKIEDEMRELYELKSIESYSRKGVSIVELELDDHYTEVDVDEIWSKVRDRLVDVQAQLPPGASPPDFEAQTTIASSLVAGLIWEGEGPAPLGILTRLADELASRLRSLPGTREAELFGDAEEEIRVTVDPVVMAALGLSAAEVGQAVAAADTKTPAGQLRASENDLVLEVAGELDSLGRIRAIPIREQTDGTLLRVRDVASVERTVRSPARSIAILSGQPGIAVSATMEPYGRIDLWSVNARGIVDDFQRSVPAGVRLEVLFEQAVYTNARLRTLVGNLFLGAAIVVGVLVVMMGVRSALLVATAMPLTLGMVLGGFLLVGMPLHQMSITGLIIALGLLIDNAIVVVDEFNSMVDRGRSRLEAVSGVVRHLFVPLLASTATTAFAFLPIVLMPGGGGEFVGPISVGVIWAVGCSFFLAMTVIPALAGFFGRERSEGGSAWWQSGYSNPDWEARYRRSLGIALRRPALGIGLSIVLPVLGFVAGSTLVEQFFPANDVNLFQVQIALPRQASLSDTKRATERVRSLVEDHPEVVESHWFVGEIAPRVYYNMLGSSAAQSSFASGFVTTQSATATEGLLPRLQRELMDALPEARVIALPFEQGPPFEAPIEARIVGPDIDVLRSLGEEARSILAETDDVTYTVTKIEAEPVVRLVPNEDATRSAGLSLSDLAGQLEAQLEGSSGGSVVEGTEEVPVRVRVGARARDSIDDVLAARIQPRGAPSPQVIDRMAGLPLAAVASVELVPEVAGITRRNGERTNTVQGYLVPYTLIAESLADFRRRLDAAGLELPAGYRIEFGGEDEQRSEAMGNLVAFALPLLVLMAGTAVLAFDSFRFAAIVWAVAGLSIGLALLGVWSFGYPMGFVAIVGTMGLMGLAINDAIVVLAALRSDDRALLGDLDAIEDVVVGATRHILATTFTTIGGFLPLILFGGRFWPPMATAIAGGVGGASILALYLVPATFSIFQSRAAAKRAAAPSPAVGGPAAPEPHPS